MIPLSIFLIFSFFLFSFESKEVEKIQTLLCDDGDMKALIEFSQEFESRIEGWEIDASPPNCCTWPGITCIADNITTTNTGRVIKLELQSKRLKGILPQSLGRLEHLKTLNLSINLLESPIPASLLHLPHLEVLDLSSNYLFGSLPESMDLPSIRALDVSDNNIKGLIPGGICSNSTRIAVLNLGVNYFEGTIPDGLGNCSSLVDLNLSGNDLTGAFPEALFRLKGLTKLAIQSNKISGKLIQPVSKLSNLVHLDISLNNFRGNLPDIFQEFEKLGFFSAHSNQFSGEIPLSLANSPTISGLYLGNNSLSGKIQINCSAMRSLTLLDLGNNTFTAPFPRSLLTCTQLRTLNLARFNLSGNQLPEEIKNLQSLSSLSLSNTGISNISSAVQTLSHCRNLTTLVLTANFLGEEMPQDLNLDMSRLKILSLANCGLTGKIPKWLNGCRDLQILDLSVNGFHGQIPRWFQDLKSLFYLDMSNNKLSGDIPVHLTTFKSFISSGLNITFEDRPTFGFALYLKRNKSEKALQYNQLFSFPKTLDLSNNQITGQIPPEFGSMTELQILDLRFNKLTGTIPSELGEMKSLTDLDLSHNKLFGPIPPSFTSLTFLRKFSVAYNNISGVVPSGGQFDTFNRTSFEGNEYLCGEEFDPCSEAGSEDHDGSTPLDGDDEQMDLNSIHIAIGVGIFFFVVSFSLEMYFSWIWKLFNFHHNLDRPVRVFEVLQVDTRW